MYPTKFHLEFTCKGMCKFESATFSEGNMICIAFYDGELGVLLGRDLKQKMLEGSGGKWGTLLLEKYFT